MNCEQVEELLSAYLDNALAPEEIAGVTAHLQQCGQCRSMLADFRRFDALLRQLPRVSPSPALRKRIFSSPEYLGLTGTFDANSSIFNEHTRPIPGYARRNTAGRPHLVAMPGGRSTSPRQPSPSDSQRREFALPTSSRRWHASWGVRAMRVAIAVAFLLTIGIASLIGRNLWLQQASLANLKGAITPPAGLQQGPLPVGMRFVFLRDGALWSTPADGSTAPVRLTPTTVTVAANWVISPALPGRSAGDMLAYIDLQHAQIHTIRSDGQADTVVPQPLLKAGVAPSSIWDTDAGAAILSSLTWSKDGHMLAFVADPNATGLTNLYILSMDTSSVELVPLAGTGSVSYPTWSPDGVRLAFEFTSGSTVSIMDYNTQNHGVLTITDGVRTPAPANSADTVLTLNWSPDMNAPTITWSVGTIGHVHSIWIRRVGVGGTEKPELLTSGDYVQAIYSPAGHAGIGSWLLVTSIAGRQGDIWSVDAIVGTRLLPLTSGKQVGFAWWSPNGTQVDYLDGISSGLGTLHVVNVTTGADTFVADGVVDEPAPAWSEDSQALAYSTGSQTVVVNLNTGNKIPLLTLRGPASALIWSTSSADQLVAALSDRQQGIYLVDIRRNASLQIDTLGINGPILWTEVP